MKCFLMRRILQSHIVLEGYSHQYVRQTHFQGYIFSKEQLETVERLWHFSIVYVHIG